MKLNKIIKYIKDVFQMHITKPLINVLIEKYHCSNNYNYIYLIVTNTIPYKIKITQCEFKIYNV